MPIYANSTLKSQNRHWHKLGRIGLTTPQFLLLRGASQFIDEETPGHDKFVDEDDYGKTPEHMGKYSAIAKYKEDAAKEGSVSFIP